MVGGFAALSPLQPVLDGLTLRCTHPGITLSRWLYNLNSIFFPIPYSEPNQNTKLSLVSLKVGYNKKDFCFSLPYMLVDYAVDQ